MTTIDPRRGARVSVVVITRNRRAELLETLPRHLRLPERPPVIVVDNGSDDDTVTAVAAAHPSVMVAAVGRNMGAAGRNVGVALADTPYIAFADDDSWWEPGALAAAASLLDSHPRLALVAAQVVVGNGRGVDPTCHAMATSPLPAPPDLPGPMVLGFIACGAVVRAAPFLAVGGFDQLMEVGGEERLLAMDLATAGWGLCYAADAVAVHVPSSAGDRDERRRRVIRNDLWHAWLRRHWVTAARQTAQTAATAVGDRHARGALIDALRQAPTVLGMRRPLPPEIERQMCLLERAPRCSPLERRPSVTRTLRTLGVRRSGSVGAVGGRHWGPPSVADGASGGQS